MTEQERTRIQEEERLRYEIRSQLRRRSYRWIWWVIAASLILLGTLWGIGRIRLQHKLAVGSEVVLLDTAFTFESPDALDRFVAMPSDQAVEILGPSAFKIPSGSRVRIVKADSHRRCIAPVKAIHPLAGWVELDWLERFSTPPLR